ncbi:MAG TPA: iron hydrogenase small subunit [Syntrophales bacterium]|nr:iron hydrogenase small subunit [Syntrophales bacterium]HPQ44134.1 iron hydrogenase small subunit [Syntrophales bacterium]
MKEERYRYEENPSYVSRREFITISGIVIAILALPAVWIRSAVVKRNSYIRARINGLYKDDTSSKIRVSHANSGVTKLYKEFAGHPLSNLSEELFHTEHYIDRTRI